VTAKRLLALGRASVCDMSQPRISQKKSIRCCENYWIDLIVRHRDRHYELLCGALLYSFAK
jgi:hypothetical protein